LFALLTDQLVDWIPRKRAREAVHEQLAHLKFAAANQFYMIANSHGLDYERSAPDWPGLPAGRRPARCRVRGRAVPVQDTMPGWPHSTTTTTSGHSAMLVNEGWPLYIVQRLEASYATWRR